MLQAQNRSVNETRARQARARCEVWGDVTRAGQSVGEHCELLRGQGYIYPSCGARGSTMSRTRNMHCRWYEVDFARVS